MRLFPFIEGDNWGYIDRNGTVLVQPIYDSASDFHEGLAKVVKDEQIGYIDEHGDLVFTIPRWATRPFSNSLAVFDESMAVDDKKGYFDKQGNVAIEPAYDDARDFSEGLAPVNLGAKSERFPRPFLRVGGKWGFIDKTGKTVIPMQFDFVDPKGFSEGLALVYGSVASAAYIDKVGTVVIGPSDKPGIGYDFRGGFVEGRALITHSSDSGLLWGYIDKLGKPVIKPRFVAAHDFSDGLAAVAVDKKWGYIDRNGTLVIPPQFDDAQDFSEGLAAIKQGAHWKYVNKQGVIIIAGSYNDAEVFHGGLARVHEGRTFEMPLDDGALWQGGAWFYIDRKGERIRLCCPDQKSPGFGAERR